MRRIIVGIVALGLFVVSGGPAAAQTLRQVVGAIEQNQRLLKSYAWEMRIEIFVDGASEKTELYSMRYDLDGELQRTLISEEASPVTGGPIRKKMKKSKVKKARERRAELKRLIDAYIHPDDEALRKMASHAKMTPASGNRRGQTRISIRDVERIGDTMDVFVDNETFVETHYEILTAILGDPVRVTTDYKTLEGGVNYPAQMIVDTEYDGQKIQFKIETYDYVPQD